MPQNVRASFTTQENNWFSEDKGILEFKAIKNELESFVYELKNNLDSYGNFEAYMEPNQRSQVIASL
jgi:hypothetical protein